MRDFTGLDLNLLTTLDVLLRERNVTRAARKLAISQSAMSHRLKRLREVFGDPLLVNGAKGLVPTERASKLELPLRDALAGVGAVVRGVEPFAPAHSRRRFVVMGSDYGEVVLIPELLARVRRVAPHIEIVLENARPDAARLLEDGLLDLVVGPPIATRAGMMTRKLGEHAFVVAHRSGHPLDRKRLTLSRYAAASHLLVAPQGAQSGPVDEALAKRGLRRHVALTTRHFSTAPGIVAHSDLLWTAPREIAVNARDRFSLQLRRPPLALPAFAYYMSWHERAQVDPAHRWLRGLIVDVRGSTQPKPRSVRGSA